MIRRLLGLLLIALVVTPIPLASTATAAATKTAVTDATDCADWPMYGANPQRTFAAKCASAIDASTVARLAPAWVLDTPKPVTASPTVVDGVVYVGAWDGVMYALDAVSGAVRWKFQTPPAPGATYGPIVSSAAVGDVGIAGKRERIVVFGAGPFVYALRARDGKQVWRHDASRGLPASPTEYESSPVIVDDLIIIGRDTHNEGVAETGGVRGGVVALRAATGVPVWLFEPELDRKGDGCGGVWGSPTISPDKQTVFFGAANCPRDNFKWTPHTNAVTALNLKTGAPIWAFQPTGPPDQDTDFGATPNYFTDRNGRAVLGAGKKDGTYYALNPSTGKQLWRRNVATPAPGIGGFIGSPAIHDGNIFGGTAIGSPPFFHSLDGLTGAIRFQGGAGPTYGASAVVNDVVFNAALDDLLKAYDANTGRLLWSTPPERPRLLGPVDRRRHGLHRRGHVDLRRLRERLLLRRPVQDPLRRCSGFARWCPCLPSRQPGQPAGGRRPRSIAGGHRDRGRPERRGQPAQRLRRAHRNQADRYRVSVRQQDGRSRHQRGDLRCARRRPVEARR